MNMKPEGADWPSMVLLRLLTANWLPQAISVVAKMQIADRLGRAPRSCLELASECDCRPDALERLMEALAEASVFARDGDGRYMLTPISERLRSDHPRSLRHTAMLKAMHDYQAWSELFESVRTGCNAYEIAFGQPLYERMAADTDMADMFDASMTEMTALISTDIAALVEAANVTMLLDVGGGTGSFAVAMLRRLPRLRVVLVDRAPTVERAKRRLEEASLLHRCDPIPGDFFTDLPRGCNGITLIRVLQNWDDVRALCVLRRCAEALPVGAPIFVVEVARESSCNESGGFADLNMFVLTGGRVRTLEQFRSLAAAADLAIDEAVVCSGPFRALAFRTRE